MTEDHVSSCIACQAAVGHSNVSPLKPSPLPDAPWKELSCDFTGPLPSGEHLMLVIDNYSRFPVVKVIKTTSSRTVIPELREIFSLFGRPNTLKTDNGAPFNGNEFSQFADDYGFNHIKITPRWPQANGEAERFMKPLMKAIQCANVEEKPWRTELQSFLMNYRSTPHSTTGKAPNELIFNRKIETNIPCIASTPGNESVKKMDETKKMKMKTEYDNRKCKGRYVQLKVGDRVLLKRDSKRKNETIYHKEVYVIVKINGTQIIARNKGRSITRNSSFFKLLRHE